MEQNFGVEGATLPAQIAQLKELIYWLLGERTAFWPPKDYQGGPYWWRTELRQRFEAILARSAAPHPTRGQEEDQRPNGAEETEAGGDSHPLAATKETCE